MKNKVKKAIYFSKNRINLPPGWFFWKINNNWAVYYQCDLKKS
ncbi:MAG: hypothetical protein Q7V10_05065 [Methanobacteriaceae archaeon]|nr:hypothetical protein [Methanobacteriaceae archaeon]MDO9627657.1 hypothetical protein [Methanobacteriaceae archaeon]